MSAAISELRGAIAESLGNLRPRANIRRAMLGLQAKRARAFPDAEERERLRDQGEAIRAYSVAHLPELLEELERNCTRNGIRVHWAESGEDANRIVLEILRSAGVSAVLKGKSMVSEEMGLNHFLAEHGIEPVETDLGELIIQLAGEAPSHIIAPAVHKDRQEIAELFREKFPDLPRAERIEELTALAREVMRTRFRGMIAGLSGVNFAVAETGTLCLVENEGNGRLCTAAPDLHIAVTGIEKVIARLDQLPTLLTLLTRSATGQPVTTYVNMISGPRRPGELDGPREVHLVLLDNGRSRIRSDPELAATLRCIRCGACMNHCPVYTRLGGHAYGTVYPGPIGSILEPQLQGLAIRGELAQLSTLCGACAEVCPVRIPIPQLLRRLRQESVRLRGAQGEARTVKGEGSRRAPGEARLWAAWAWVCARPRVYRALTGLAPLARILGPSAFDPWTRTRAAPPIAARSLHRLVRSEGDWDQA
jgi:L-lactate dehydrogenase complex protein LldF